MRPIIKEEEDLVKGLADYKVFRGDNLTREIVSNEIKDVDAVSTKFQHNLELFLDQDNLKKAKKLKIINCCTSTFNKETYIDHGIDFDAATDLGIYITNTPVIADAIADKTWALLLSVSRKIVEADKFVREGKWKNQNVYHPRFIPYQVHNRVLGIIGLGKIGIEVIKRAKGFNMEIIYYDIERKRNLESLYNIEYVDFDTLLKKSDYVSLHTGPVHHLIGERELHLMRKNAILINTARGVCIDTHALYQALKNNDIAGAGLDVFEVEPIEPENPLLTLNNVILMPHASSEIESFTKSFQLGLENIFNVLNGKKPKSLVNKEIAPK
jgi:glyoxylate reductase